MNNLLQYASRVAVRRVVYVIVAALLAYCGIGRASAATYSEVYQQCNTYIASQPPVCTGGCGATPVTYSYRCVDGTGFNVLAQRLRSDQSTWTTSQSWVWAGSKNCPAGQELNPAGGCRCTGGYIFDPASPTTCLTSQKCLTRNAALGLNPSRPSLATARCVAGCEFGMGSDAAKYEVTSAKVSGSGDTPRTVYRGRMEYSGNACGSLPVDPDWNEAKAKAPNDQECQGVGGQTLCVKKDGQHCYKASTNRMMCWYPGETGEKGDGSILQKRNAGATDIPPANLQLPSGDTLTKSGDAITETHTTNNTSTSTTTTNYITTNNTNVSDKDKGQTNNGQSGVGVSVGGGSGNGDGKDDGEENGVSGGQNCESPPSTTGDPLLGEVVRQQFYTRCGDGSGPPDPSDYSGEEAETQEIGEVGGDFVPNQTGSGWGGSCPSIPVVSVFGASLDFNSPVICNWMVAGGWFVLLIAGLACARILTGA